jgi:hypothetical protein
MRWGVEGVVEIESEWTGRKRERMGLPLRLKLVGMPVTFGGCAVKSGGSAPTLSPKSGEKGGAPRA